MGDPQPPRHWVIVIAGEGDLDDAEAVTGYVCRMLAGRGHAVHQVTLTGGPYAAAGCTFTAGPGGEPEPLMVRRPDGTPAGLHLPPAQDTGPQWLGEGLNWPADPRT